MFFWRAKVRNRQKKVNLKTKNMLTKIHQFQGLRIKTSEN